LFRRIRQHLAQLNVRQHQGLQGFHEPYFLLMDCLGEKRRTIIASQLANDVKR
jgi:hypothetical protein